MADIGQVGFAVEVADDGGHRHDAAELEKLGYSALWLPGGQLDRPDRVLDLLAATRSVAIGTAVLSAAVYGPDDVLGLYHAAQRQAPGRAILGLGGPQDRRSLAAVDDFLDRLDTAQPPLPPEDRLLAALGPRKPYAGEMVRGACASAITHGSLLVIAETDGSRSAEDDLVRGMADRQLDGLVYGPRPPSGCDHQ